MRVLPGQTTQDSSPSERHWFDHSSSLFPSTRAPMPSLRRRLKSAALFSPPVNGRRCTLSRPIQKKNRMTPGWDGGFAPVILVLSHFMATPARATLPRYRELKHVGIRMRDHSVLDLKPPTTARPAATHVPRTAFDPAPHPETVRACQRIHSGRAPGLRPPPLPQQSRRGRQRNPANRDTSCDKLPSCCSSSCLARHIWPRSSAVS